MQVSPERNEGSLEFGGGIWRWWTEPVTAQEGSAINRLSMGSQRSARVWSMGRHKGEVGRNLGGAELVGLVLGGREGGAEQGLKTVSKATRRKEETSPLCQQECAEGQVR